LRIWESFVYSFIDYYGLSETCPILHCTFYTSSLLLLTTFVMQLYAKVVYSSPDSPRYLHYLSRLFPLLVRAHSRLISQSCILHSLLLPRITLLSPKNVYFCISPFNSLRTLHRTFTHVLACNVARIKFHSR